LEQIIIEIEKDMIKTVLKKNNKKTNKQNIAICLKEIKFGIYSMLGTYTPKNILEDLFEHIKEGLE
jgi:hypothetical protein